MNAADAPAVSPDKEEESRPKRPMCSSDETLPKKPRHAQTWLPSALPRSQPPSLPLGLTIIPEFITDEEEATLLAHIREQPWCTDLKRRVQQYGYKYVYSSRKFKAGSLESLRLGDLPHFLHNIVELVMARDLMPNRPDQAIVNEYTPGQGISPHVDNPRLFGPVVVSVSLGSGCTMSFALGGKDKTDVWLEPRSALVMSGAARYKYTHAIAGRKFDTNDTGRKVARSTRVSITLRTMVSTEKEIAEKRESGV